MSNSACFNEFPHSSHIINMSLANQLVGMQHLHILLLCDYLVTLKILVAGSVITIAHEHNLVRFRQAMID